MDSLIFAFGAVAPIIFTVGLGYILKRIGLFPIMLVKPLNKLVFRVLLPAMLFLNLYSVSSLSSVTPGYILYSVGAILVIFAISLVVSILATKEPSRRGPMIQCGFRSNYALIGIPLSVSLLGNAAAASATLLSAISIPTFNILAVIALSVFDSSSKRVKIGDVLLKIVKNPLIIAVALGLGGFFLKDWLTELGLDLTIDQSRKDLYTAVYTTLEYLSRSATPIALLVLGAQFEFSTIGQMKKDIGVGVMLRCIIAPIVGLVCTIPFASHLEPVHYACFVGLFATPVAVSTVPMAQEMGADTEYAGQLVVFTTLCSALTIFVSVAILRALGIF